MSDSVKFPVSYQDWSDAEGFEKKGKFGDVTFAVNNDGLPSIDVYIERPTKARKTLSLEIGPEHVKDLAKFLVENFEEEVREAFGKTL